MHWFFIGIIVENQWKISKKSNIGKRDTLSNLGKSKTKNPRLEGHFCITNVGKLCNSPTLETEKSNVGRLYVILPSLVIYVIFQHWKHRNPRLEGHICITNVGKLCNSPTLETEKSNVGRLYVILPSLVIYVIFQHWKHRNPRLEGHICITNVGKLCNSPTLETEKSNVGRLYVILPSLVTYMIFQYWKHRIPKLEGHSCITNVGNLCNSPTLETEKSYVGRLYVILPSLVIYVIVQHWKREKQILGLIF